LAQLQLPLVAQPHLHEQSLPHLHLPLSVQPHLQGQAAFLPQSHVPLVPQPHLQAQSLLHLHLPLSVQPHLHGQPLAEVDAEAAVCLQQPPSACTAAVANVTKPMASVALKTATVTLAI
jgi:hypothetical protein